MSTIIITKLQDLCIGECDGDYRYIEVPLLKPTERLAEVNESFANTRITTPQVLDKDVLRWLLKLLVPNIQEYRCNLRNITQSGPGTELARTLTTREVTQHNSTNVWNKWIIYKGKVYDIMKLTGVALQLVEATREVKTSDFEKKEGREENKASSSQDNDDRCTDDSCSDYYKDTELLIKDGIQLLDREKIEDLTSSCCVGSLLQTEASYWDDLRRDIKDLLNYLIRQDFRDALSPYQAEYMHLLQRWIKKYRTHDPKNYRRLDGDPNLNTFSLPEGIEESPECLRAWIETWEPFDLALPQNGAWHVKETEYIDLGDCHTVFLSTLKSSIDLSPLDTTINGEAAWEVINEHIFADDIMTDKQKTIERERKNITDFFNPQKMKKRRHCILQYFIFKYQFDKAKVAHFLNWAAEMKNGEDRFLQLCDNS